MCMLLRPMQQRRRVWNYQIWTGHRYRRQQHNSPAACSNRKCSSNHLRRRRAQMSTACPTAGWK
ncbi:hypothetical protein IWW55_001210 [Coemansia sp. RSA 2706]|nr:hypothetical protein IWW55_001210 [Coemansia sp. RSA 2706]